MLANFPCPFVVIDAQARVVGWSEVTASFFGTCSETGDKSSLTVNAVQVSLWSVLPQAWIQPIQALLIADSAVEAVGETQVYHPETETWWRVQLLGDFGGQRVLLFWDFTQTQTHLIWLEAQLTELRRWYDRFQTIAQISQQVFWEWHAEDDTTLWVGDTQALFGYSPSEMPQTAQAWISLIHPDDRDAVESGWRQSQTNQRIFCVEYRIRCADGHYCWIRDCSQYTSSEPGGPRLLGVVLDITFRKDSEAGIAETELQFQNLVANLPGHVFRCANDPHWTIQYLSETIQETVGYPAAEFINNCQRTFASIIHPEDQDYVYETIQKFFASQNHYGVEYRVVRADGELRWFYESGQAIYDENGVAKYIDGIALDITTQKQAELELVKSEARFRQLIEDVDVGVLVHSPNGDIILANERAAAVLGLSRDELLGKSDRDPDWYITDETGHRLSAEQFPSAQASRTRQPIREVVLGINRPLQGLAWLQVTAEPYFDDQDHLQQVIVTLSDITQRKTIENALRYQSQREQTLNRVVKAIRNSLDLEEIFQTTVAEVGSMMNLERVVIAQYRPDRGEWHHLTEFRSHADVPPMTGMVIPDAENLIADRLKRGETVKIDPAEGNQDLDSFNQELFQTFPGNWLILPLESEHHPWGALTVHRMDTTQAWQPSDISFLEVIADQLAVAIRQAELYQSLQAANQELSRLAITDDLTQIANRRHFDYCLAREWQRLARNPAPLSLIFCDVDDFKAYNDLYGHPAGDECLYLVAQVLASSVHRSGDLVARYGGEEFAIILPNTDELGAQAVVEAIQGNLRGLGIPHSGSRSAEVVTVSFGISVIWPRPNDSPISLLAAADQALYQAKQQGRNTFRVVNLCELSTMKKPDPTSSPGL